MVQLIVLAAVTVNPNISVREINIHGIPCSIARILRSSRFHPYHISFHELTANDFALRVNFCHWAQQRIR